MERVSSRAARSSSLALEALVLAAFLSHAPAFPEHALLPELVMDRFARRVYTVAGIYGLIVTLPQYFLEDRIGRDTPPPITHPEHFYGFIGVVVAWQIAFLVIARDPARFRALMPVTVLEKLAFAVPVLLLWARGRVAGSVLPFAGLDLLLGALFLASYLRTRGA